MTRRRPSVLVRLMAITLAAGCCVGCNATPAGPSAGDPMAGDDLAQGTTRGADRPFRLVAFNIHSAKGDDGRRDLARVAAELADADFIALNEVNYAWNQPRQLADWLNLALLPAPTERRLGRDHFGNAVLTRLPVEAWHVLPLARRGDGGWRNLVIVQTRVGRTPITILATHLDTGEDRRHQLDAVLWLFEHLPAPVVLMGDLNTTAADPRLAATLARPDVDDPLARLAGVGPGTHIDWLLLRPGDAIQATAAGLRDSPASDHPVAWVDLMPAPQQD